MKYKEFKGMISKPIGLKVWICDYRLNSKSDLKPIRNIRPTLVEVVDNKELPKNKNVYYTDFHFRPISKKGKTLKQIIAPYDNTGYRSFSGTSVNIFLNKEDCIDCFKVQCSDVKKRYRMKISEIEEKIEEVEDIEQKFD